jgi:hypothetical protein
MEVGLKRTTIARITAAVGSLCGAIGLLTALTGKTFTLAPHGWGTGAILFLLIALYVLIDGMVSFEKSRLNAVSKH